MSGYCSALPWMLPEKYLGKEYEWKWKGFWQKSFLINRIPRKIKICILASGKFFSENFLTNVNERCERVCWLHPKCTLHCVRQALSIVSSVKCKPGQPDSNLHFLRSRGFLEQIYIHPSRNLGEFVFPSWGIGYFSMWNKRIYIFFHFSAWVFLRSIESVQWLKYS